MRNQHGGNDFRIHHLVLSKTGMYVLETKEWTGKLIHGLTKENASTYSFMIDEIGKYQQEIEKEETFEYITGEDSLTIQVKMTGTQYIERRNYLIFYTIV